jgi:hypothetical protein
MSINSSEKYYGAAILRLIKSLGDSIPNANFSISTGDSKSSFTIKGNIPKTLGKGSFASCGLFIKISNKRLSPWRYNFIKEHQDEILELKKQHTEVFICFICGDDGIASINFTQLKDILDDHHEDQEWVSISRKLKENYRLKGNDGNYEKALPRNSFPGNVIDYFARNL